MNLKQICFLGLTIASFKYTVAQSLGYKVPVCKGMYITGTQTFVTGSVFTKENNQIYPVLSKVSVKGTNYIVSTNHAGVYKLNITDAIKSEKDLILVVSANGYSSKEVALNKLPAHSTSVDFDLTANQKKK